MKDSLKDLIDRAIPGPDVPQRITVSEPIVQIEFSTEADFLEHRKAAEASVQQDAFVLREVAADRRKYHRVRLPEQRNSEVQSVIAGRPCSS